VVLMAAAIILIPEMLSGPNRDAEEAEPAAQRGGEGAIKTYTIDLSQSPGASATTPGGGDNRSPPPEESASPAAPSPAQVTQANPEVTPPASTVEAPRTVAELAEEPPPPPVVESTPPQVASTPPRAETPTPSAAAPSPVSRAETPSPPQQRASAPAPKPLASAPAAPMSGSWAVQLGSFSKQATAEKLANEWRSKGQEAFVMPVKSGGTTLYRVRIGPMKDRAGAESTLRSVKASTPGATVVAHP
jgi:DedD protein